MQQVWWTGSGDADDALKPLQETDRQARPTIYALLFAALPENRKTQTLQVDQQARAIAVVS